MNVRLANYLKNSFTLPANNFPLWDGWRGLAILCVLTGHFMGTESIKEDRLGVDIFFVLSGMLMARILFEKRTDLKTFYVRRFSRIFPALLFFVLYTYGVASLLGWQFNPIEIFANLTFIRTYFPAEPHIWSGLVPVKNLWSLNVEEHAYVIMSLITLFLLGTRNTAWLLLSIGVLSVVISLYYNATQNYDETYFLLRTESAIGFVTLSAAYRLIQHQHEIRVNAWLPVIALLLAISCYLVALPFWMSFVFPPFLLAFAVNHLPQCTELFRGLLSLKVLRLLGLWSYSIYLWQQPVFEYKWAIPGPDFGLPLVLAISAGIASFTFIESPARNTINRWWSERQKAATTAV